MKKRIAVLGAGAWGITLAQLLHDNSHAVTLWEFNPQQAQKLKEKRRLSFFRFVTIDKSIEVTSDLKHACLDKDFIVFVLPSHVLRSIARKLGRLRIDFSKTLFISATKGIENTSLMRMSEILLAELPVAPPQIAVLSGPTIAREVAKKIPTAVTVASRNEKTAHIIQKLFMTPSFRTYVNQDVAGVEAGGALKNVFAIASGICDGLRLGDNTKAALITRGMRELIQLGTRIGGKPATFFGLAGLGDLIVTCSSPYSRNRSLGEKIGKGESLTKAEKEIIMVAEGVKTARSAYALSRKYSLNLPIIEQIFQVLFCSKKPKQAVEELMTREAKSELKLTIGSLVI